MKFGKAIVSVIILLQEVTFAGGLVSAPNVLVEEPQRVLGSETRSSTNEGYQVKGAHIFYQNKQIKLKGINWFGLDTVDLQLHGLWNGKPIEQYINEVRALGFNAFRIPVSPEAIESKVNLQVFLDKALHSDMYVLVDIHNCHASQGHEVGSYCDSTLDDLKKLAEIVKPFPNVVGIDVFNEPYLLSWNDWKDFVETAARAVLKIQPNILIFAEGVGEVGGEICESFPKENDRCLYAPFWGENLSYFEHAPLDIPKDKLVLAPHVYGPSVHDDHSYFNTDQFPSNMPAIWDSHFGYLAGKIPLVIGEFGGRSDQNRLERLWQETFVSYLMDKNIEHFFYWSLNPNSHDTQGLYNDDWQTINQTKLNIIKPLLNM